VIDAGVDRIDGAHGDDGAIRDGDGDGLRRRRRWRRRGSGGFLWRCIVERAGTGVASWAGAGASGSGGWRGRCRLAGSFCRARRPNRRRRRSEILRRCRRRWRSHRGLIDDGFHAGRCGGDVLRGEARSVIRHPGRKE
jgi:hypothetical protein